MFSAARKSLSRTLIGKENVIVGYIVPMKSNIDDVVMYTCMKLNQDITDYMHRKFFSIVLDPFSAYCILSFLMYISYEHLEVSVFILLG